MVTCILKGTFDLSVYISIAMLF